MRSTIILLAFFISQVMAVDRSTDRRYCTSKLCGTTNHACMNNGSQVFCKLKGATLLTMTKYIGPFTELFNNVRNDVASGKYRNLPQAARMAKMSWTEELAWFAHLQVVLCVKTRLQCLNSPYFYYVGLLTEEVFRDYGDNEKTNFAIMREVIEHWVRDVSYISRRETLRLPRKFEKSTTLRAALLINERNTHFGCAVMYFKKNEHFIFSCAFATANLIGRPIYKWGLSPAIRCHKRDAVFQNLCAAGENYGNEKSGPSYEIMDDDII